MTRDDLQPWLSWMPGWLLLPVTAALLVCICYPLFAARGLLMGLKQARVNMREVLQIVRDIVEKEKSDG